MQRTYKGTTVACYIGYFVQAIINNLSPILFIIYREQLGISLNAIGSLILINFLSQTVVDVISVKVVDRVGYRKIILASHTCAAVGLFLLGILPRVMPAFFGLTIATVISALGSGMIEVTISPIVDAIPSDRKQADMSLLHSFYCWGQMAVVALSTLFIRLFGEQVWYVLPMLWAFIPLGNLFNFSTLPFPRTLQEDEKTPVHRLLTSRHFIIAMILMFCAGASELAMSQWSSYFAEAGLGVGKFMGDL
ncbi:MAG: MFS transporter, partial [Candidatus Fimenecus sp.]